MKVIGKRFTPAPSDIVQIDASRLGERQVLGKVTLPPKRLTDPTFNYRRSCDTNIRDTWDNARKEQQA